MHKSNNTLLVIFLIAIQGYLGFDLEAQPQVKVFEDLYGVQGRMTYTGSWNDSLLPASGPFTLQWRNLAGDTLRTYKAAGRLRAHLPHGSWTWEEADWKYTIEPGDAIAPAIAADGVHSVWKASFENGIAHGKWIFAEGEPEVDPNSNALPLRMEVNLSEGRFNKGFSIIDRRDSGEVRIAGNCDVQGVASGTWTFTYHHNGQSVLETHTYDRGVMVNRTIKPDSAIADMPDFQKRVVMLGATRDSSSGVVVGAYGFGYEEVGGHAALLLQKYIEERFCDGWQLPEFPFRPAIKQPIFRRLAFPIRPDEDSLRMEITAKTAALRKDISERFEGRNVEIKRSRSAGLDLSIGYAQSVLERLNFVDSLLAASHEELFIYKDRNFAALNAVFDSINAMATYEGKVYPEARGVLPLVELRHRNAPYFRTLMHSIESLEPGVSEWMVSMDRALAEIMKEGELRDLEQQMLARVEVLDTLYFALEGMGAHVRTQWVAAHLGDAIKQYAQMDEYIPALAQAEILLAQMDSLIAWATIWEPMDQYATQLNEAYSYYAYNPYTGERDIELSVKNRFRRNVQEVLLPWMTRQVLEADTWENFADLQQQSQNMQAALIRFAFIDNRADRRIEKRMRREQDPERMHRIFMNHMEI